MYTQVIERLRLTSEEGVCLPALQSTKRQAVLMKAYTHDYMYVYRTTFVYRKVIGSITSGQSSCAF